MTILFIKKSINKEIHNFENYYVFYFLFNRYNDYFALEF